MAAPPRKKSPSSPSIPLDDAVARALEVYNKEQRHAAPVDAVARDLGYKSANNGSALSALATLRQYGLLVRPERGKLAVSADVQSYRYAPDEELKRELLIKWLRSPPLFAQLLDKYERGLPSDATLQYDLIREGFKPGTAEATLEVLKQSVEFVGYYADSNVPDQAVVVGHESDRISRPTPPQPAPADVDRIPVRLDGQRRAWLEIPTPFYERDKQRLKAQIDLLITDEQDDGG